MMLALLLAQLVLPWPGLDSPLVQPGPTICLGACAGPVVWGPAERGRLVVACDMRSDTCSDGRKITTTRATPVPCEVAPGVWEILPADRGCYSVRGLESWAQTTSYLSYGAELDQSPWRVDDSRNTKLEALLRGYRISGIASNSRLIQSGIQPIPGPYTLACILRTDEPKLHTLRLYWGAGPFVQVPVTSTWATYSITQTVPEDASTLGVHIFSHVGTLDVIGCWLTRTDTPGRACWGGEAPVTCAVDRHTISTEGWPTESGEVCVTVTLGEDAPSPAVILDGRASSGDVGTVLYQHSNSLRWKTGSTELFAPALQRGKPYRVCAGRSGGRLYVRVNGAHHEGPEAPALSWEPTAYLGHGRVVSNVINGSISSLRVRSFE